MEKINLCQWRSAHEHPTLEHVQLHGWGDLQHGVKTVTAFIDFHERPFARAEFARIRGRRPVITGLSEYARSIHWAGGAKTDQQIADERASAERQYAEDERSAAADLGLSIGELRALHWSGSSHVADEAELRKDLAWVRGDVASSRDRSELAWSFPEPVTDLKSFRFNPSNWGSDPRRFRRVVTGSNKRR